jgi:hypothetical protein
MKDSKDELKPSRFIIPILPAVQAGIQRSQSETAIKTPRGRRRESYATNSAKFDRVAAASTAARYGDLDILQIVLPTSPIVQEVEREIWNKNNLYRLNCKQDYYARYEAIVKETIEILHKFILEYKAILESQRKDKLAILKDKFAILITDVDSVFSVAVLSGQERIKEELEKGNRICLEYEGGLQFFVIKNEFKKKTIHWPMVEQHLKQKVNDDIAKIYSKLEISHLQGLNNQHLNYISSAEVKLNCNLKRIKKINERYLKKRDSAMNELAELDEGLLSHRKLKSQLIAGLIKEGCCPGTDFTEISEREYWLAWPHIDFEEFAQNKDGKSLFEMAFQHSQEEVMIYLIESHQYPVNHLKEVLAKELDEHGNTLLHQLFQQKFLDIIYLLIKHQLDHDKKNKAGINLLNIQDDQGDTLGHHVIRTLNDDDTEKRQVDVLICLINKDAEFMKANHQNRRFLDELEELKDNQLKELVISYFIAYVCQRKTPNSSPFQINIESAIASRFEEIKNSDKYSWFMKLLHNNPLETLEKQRSYLNDLQGNLLKGYLNRDDSPVVASILEDKPDVARLSSDFRRWYNGIERSSKKACDNISGGYALIQTQEQLDGAIYTIKIKKTEDKLNGMQQNIFSLNDKLKQEETENAKLKTTVAELTMKAEQKDREHKQQLKAAEDKINNLKQDVENNNKILWQELEKLRLKFEKSEIQPQNKSP